MTWNSSSANNPSSSPSDPNNPFSGMQRALPNIPTFGQPQHAVIPIEPRLILPAHSQTALGFYDSAAIDACRFESKWLVKHFLKYRQPCIIAGPSKSTKTTILVELCVSLASGLPLWNISNYGTVRTRVAFISAESGFETIQETARRVCLSKGISLEALQENLLWSCTVIDITSPNDLEKLAKFLKESKTGVIVIDPAYLCMGDIADRVNNQFAVGPVLQKLTNLMYQTGATPILAAHTGKTIKAGDELKLSDIAHAGFGQWARQWILLNRRTEFDGSKPGVHELWLSYGGSAGHGGSWAVDINEGTIEVGRGWNYSIRYASELRK